MSNTSGVLEYKCPCCDAGLHFDGSDQKMTCPYCDNQFELEAVAQYNEALREAVQDKFQWESESCEEWNSQEQDTLQSFLCDSCAGELTTDENTAATFCPYCGNPTIIPKRLSGGLRPEGVIPFKTTKENAKQALLDFCKGKILLPKEFLAENRIEKITGIYVPFWLYDCAGAIDGKYKATRIHRWSDARYHYTRTDHFLLTRSAQADFSAIPMDGSSKLDNAVMESIEPFHQADAVDFQTAYLSGFFADKYDVEAKAGEARIRERVDNSLQELLSPTLSGYATVTPTSKQLQVEHNKARYVLMPVWLLNSVYKGENYTFAMNGQTGKITGTLPIDKTKMWTIFAAVAAGVSLLAGAIGLILF